MQLIKISNLTVEKQFRRPHKRIGQYHVYRVQQARIILPQVHARGPHYTHSGMDCLIVPQHQTTFLRLIAIATGRVIQIR